MAVAMAVEAAAVVVATARMGPMEPEARSS